MTNPLVTMLREVNFNLNGGHNLPSRTLGHQGGAYVTPSTHTVHVPEYDDGFMGFGAAFLRYRPWSRSRPYVAVNSYGTRECFTNLAHAAAFAVEV